MIKPIILFICILFISNSLHAQFYNAGQEPSILHWRKISSMHFEVIYPETFEIEAMRVVKLMEKSYQYVGNSLNHNPKPVSIILHTGTVKSNAFMGWAPNRIEMYTTPNQRIYSQDWIEQLAIHEYRHMVQMSKIDEEMPVLLRVIFGDLAAAAITAIYVPFWLLEGDAVTAETALSNSGRGRQPDFIRETKAQIVEKGAYSYSKAYLGSIKDFVPDHYQMGYFMVAGGREIKNTFLWNHVINNISKNPFHINALNYSLKKEIGINKIQLYDSVYSILERKWKQEFINYQKLDPLRINQTTKCYTNYIFPNRLTNGAYIALKKSLNQTTRFIEIDSKGKERTLFVPGSIFEESVSSNKNTIVWCEYLYNPRWEHADGTLIRTYNLETKKISEFKFNTKLFAPALSPNNSKIVAVQINDRYEFFLTIINLENGEIEEQIQTTENAFFITPSWTEDGNSIITIALKENKKSIILYSLDKKEFKNLVEPKVQEIIHPKLVNNQLYYINGELGTDQILKIDLNTNQKYQLTEVPFGVGQFSVYDSTIIYSSYRSNGYEIISHDINQLKKKIDQDQLVKYQYPFVETITKQEKAIIKFDELDSLNYHSIRFPKLNRIVNVHSWAPVYIDPYKQTAAPGISVMSQNLLSTTEIFAGYQYSYEDQAGIYNLNLKYMGLYPEFKFGIEYGQKQSSYYQIKTVNKVPIDTVVVNYNWGQLNTKWELIIPLNLTKGKWFKYLEPSLTYNRTQYSPNAKAPNSFPNGIMQYVISGLYYHQILQKSSQDLLSNFGVIVDLKFANSLNGVKSYGGIWSINNFFYLPGLMPNHGIKTYIGYQQKKYADYSFSNKIRSPRGYYNYSNTSMFSSSIEYLLPLITPDWSLGNLIYLQRINANLFYDYALLNSTTSIPNQLLKHNLSSTGIDITSDVHFLGFIAPIQIGGRSSYLLNDKRFVFNFLFSIQFNI